MVVNPSTPTRLLSRDVPEPRIRPSEVLIRVGASGVNRADLLQRKGSYHQPALARDQHDESGTPYTVAGMEAAGELVALGERVAERRPDLRVGDRVMAMCGGSYAEYAAVDARLALAVPDGLGTVAAAGLPVATMTAYDALVSGGRVRRGDTVLVTAATSAVGLVAVQLARAQGAGRVIATARADTHARLLRDLGVDDVIVDGHDMDLGPRLTSIGEPIDVVVDHVGAAVFPAVTAAMARGARYVSVGRLGGQRTELDLNALARDRLTLVGATFRTRSLRQYAAIATQVRRRVLPAIADGRLRPVLAESHPLAAANDALDSLEDPGRAGKVTLTTEERA